MMKKNAGYLIFVMFALASVSVVFHTAAATDDANQDCDIVSEADGEVSVDADCADVDDGQIGQVDDGDVQDATDGAAINTHGVPLLP